MVAGAGREGFAIASGVGAGRRGDAGSRTGGYHTLRQSPTIHGLSRPCSLRAFQRRQGGITKADNGAARRMLIAAAWSYRFPARISRDLLLSQEGQAKPIRVIAWKAQERLCRRYRKLTHAGKMKTVVTTAIARGMSQVRARRSLAEGNPPRHRQDSADFGVSIRRRHSNACEGDILSRA